MKPRNKNERFVVNELKEHVEEINEKIEEWAYQLHVKPVLFSYKKVHHCTECNHQWNDQLISDTRILKNIDCPSCKSNLKVYRDSWSKDPYISEKFYFHKLEVIKGVQVVRVFQTHKVSFKRKEANHMVNEVCQHWYLNNGKKVILRLKGGMGTGYYEDNWVFDGCLEPRSRTFGHRNREDVPFTDLYPVKKFSKYIRKFGIKNSIHGIAPEKLFDLITKDNMVEALFKMKRYNEVKYCIERGGGAQLTTTHWRSLVIANRNNYKIPNVSDWVDYLNLLNFFNKDLKSPKYICPKNFKREHDRYVEKKRKHEAKIEFESLKSSIKKDNKKYIKEKSKFFDIVIAGDNEIVIQPIKTVKDVFEEANELNHCVFTNKYHRKQDSLLLSATKNGKRLETIEVSLRTMSILQSRGKDNNPTKHHNDIVGLLKQNINLIQKAAV